MCTHSSACSVGRIDRGGKGKGCQRHAGAKRKPGPREEKRDWRAHESRWLKVQSETRSRAFHLEGSRWDICDHFFYILGSFSKANNSNMTNIVTCCLMNSTFSCI